MTKLQQTKVLPAKPRKQPQFIKHRRNRNACRQKRKNAVLTKLLEFSVLTDTRVLLIALPVTDSEKSPIVFSSDGDIDTVIDWYTGQKQDRNSELQVHTNNSVYEQYWLQGADGVQSSASSGHCPESTIPEHAEVAPSESGLRAEPFLGELVPLGSAEQANFQWDINDLRE
jgi:hypothetical protein